VHKVIDGDGHIFEWDRTFADEFLDAEFRHRRPVIVDGPQQLHWLVDNVAYPGLYGADRYGFEGSPVSRGDLRRDSIVPKEESLDVLEIRDPAERLALHREEGIDVAVGRFPFGINGKALGAGHTDGFIKVVTNKARGEIVGVHSIGYGVTDLIAEMSLAMSSEATAHDVLAAVHPHPTLSEVMLEATAAALGEAVHI